MIGAQVIRSYIQRANSFMFGMHLPRQVALSLRIQPYSFPRVALHTLSGRVRGAPTVLSKVAFTSSCVMSLSLHVFSHPINKQNKDGDTPLHLAVKLHGKSSQYKICQQFLEGGADPNIPDKEGERPLDTAVKNGHKDLILLLLSFGARSRSRGF